MRGFQIVALLLLISILSNAQNEAIYKVKKDGFYQDSIKAGIKEFEESKKETEKQQYLAIDFSDIAIPNDPEKYDQQWHTPPLSQGATGTCWCFASVSFLESEIYRKEKKEVKLSEMYIVYWEYVARAKYFIQKRGDMFLGQGSESNAVTRIMKEHGIVPASAYSGMLPGQQYHNHRNLFHEIKDYLAFVKKNNIWDEQTVVSNVKEILNHYMGEPPVKFSYKGDQITPVEYMKEVIQINPDDYYCFMSTKSKTYNQKGELEEPDNWWHNADYYNLKLDDFYSIFTHALDNGYTLSICGDVSEPGYDRYSEAAIIPSFDIPHDHINEDSRELRIYNESTTDDHCIHVVGYTNDSGFTWFLIKDSSSSAFDGPNKGYRFIREDYVRMKILAIMVHKYGAKNVLDRIIK